MHLQDKHCKYYFHTFKLKVMVLPAEIFFKKKNMKPKNK